MPALFVVLWGWLTGAPGVLRPLLGCLAAIVAYGVSVWAFGLEIASSSVHSQFWSLGGFFTVFFVVAMPWVRASFAALPELARPAATLKPRRLELFRGAFVMPFVLWFALVAWLAARGMPQPLAWIGPAVGLLGLLLLKPCLQASVREPEPLGGADPDCIAERYAAFRKRRVYGLYSLTVIISLVSTVSWTAAFYPRWGGVAGGIGGATIGMYGALFGVWADAQRYLLRRQAAEMNR